MGTENYRDVGDDIPIALPMSFERKGKQDDVERQSNNSYETDRHAKKSGIISRHVVEIDAPIDYRTL